MSKSNILLALRQGEGYVSGEDLSRQLGVTRAAIWKQIRSLREEGYIIEAHTKLGYRLVEAPSPLVADQILPQLKTRFFGRSYAYFPTIGSTNDYAKEQARHGAPEGAVAVADEQTKGRGRLGRSWVSPFGTGLYLSLILRPDVPLLKAPQVTLVVSVAVAKAIEEVSGAKPKIKWPNDILLNGKKVCGILTELNAEMESINYLIVGMGLNINAEQNDYPQEVANKATSLKIETGKEIDRSRLLVSLIHHLEQIYLEWLEHGFISIREQWTERAAAGLGCRVQIIDGSRQWTGVAKGLDEDGAFLVMDDQGTLRRVQSGEVSLRPEGSSGYDFGL